MAPGENNVDAKYVEKLRKHQQFAFEIRETIRVQYNYSLNRYWLLRWRHDMSDKPYWTIDTRREENKSDIKRNGEDSTI